MKVYLIKNITTNLYYHYTAYNPLANWWTKHLENAFIFPNDSTALSFAMWLSLSDKWKIEELVIEEKYLKS